MSAVFASCLLLGMAILASLANGQGLSTTVLCSEVACSDGWICQNACSSWCGLSEPTEDRPVCNPKTNTGDAPPPTVPANRCSITDCGFRSVDFVACPAGVTFGYKYAGTSCVRQGDNSCKWELADCQFIPTGPCSDVQCGPEPAPPSNTQIDCTGNFVGTKAHYECGRDNLGQCRWEWVPCQVGCLPGWQDMGGLCSFAGINPCAQSNLPQASIDCDPTAITQCQPDFCGGCNRRYYDKNNNEICISQTRTCSNVQCRPDYRCYEGATLGTPTCQNTLTCDNIRCDTGYKCNLTSTGPTCISDPTPFVLNCANVQCSSFHNCVPDTQGLAQCIPFSGPCSNQECATKPTCWDSSVSSGGTCSRLASGKCVWTGTSCPFQPNPPPTNAAGDRNCLVSQWTAWSCSALNCGDAGVQIRTRTVTQSATGTGQACPELIERGATCTRTCTPTPPPPVVPIGTGTCTAFPGCTTDINNKCASPITGAQCVSGTWRISQNVDVSQLGFVGCNLAITGSLTSSATTNLRIHACARITSTGTATLAGRLSLDIYNVSLASGSRVTVVQGSSISGTFGTTLVTGFSITDPSIPFRAGYTANTAFVDFGVTGTTTAGTPPTTGTTPTTTSVLNPPPSTTASTTTPTTTTPTTTSPATTSPTTTSPATTTPTTTSPATTSPTTTSPATTSPTTTSPATTSPTTTSPSTTAPITTSPPTTSPSTTSNQPVTTTGDAARLAPFIAAALALVALFF